MQLSKIDSQNFGFTIKTTPNRTKQQKRFLRDCTEGLYNPLRTLDHHINSYGLGDIFITETADGNTQISANLNNAWQQEVAQIKQVFELSKEKFGVIKEQLNDYIDNVNDYFNILFINSTKSPNKINELVKISRNISDFEENMVNSGAYEKTTETNIAV